MKQSTHMKDADGNEMFIGDIVGLNDGDNDKVVVIEPSGTFPNFRIDGLLGYWSSDMKVIGNINNGAETLTK